jgi:FtsP/CotA-like multicopper oxidase with cupredoxin domain
VTYTTKVTGTPKVTVTTATTIPTRRPVKRLTINNQWHAPAIHVRKGMQVELTVVNALDQQSYVAPEPVTLHFHGILMSGGQVIMDGPEGVTQRYLKWHYPLSRAMLTCDSGIQPGKEFTYSFNADKEGTYWIHR